jgi:GntR family transcriptional regulator
MIVEQAVNPRNIVASVIRSRIVAGDLAPNAKLDSVRELARDLKHGQATVVRAIELLVEEGYLRTVNRQGTYVTERSAWTPAPRNIAILTGVPTTFSASALAQAEHLSGMAVMQESVQRGGDRVSLHGCVHYPMGPVIRRYTQPRNLALDTMDAIVTAGIYELAYLGQLQELGIPMLAYDVDASAVRMDSVFADESDAAFRLAWGLADRGARTIALLRGPLNSRRRHELWNYDPCHAAREDGYRLAMRQRGLAEHVFHFDRSGDINAQARQMLDTLPECNAVITTASLKDKVFEGRDISVGAWISTGKAPSERVVVSAHSDQQLMGETAAELLRWRLQNPEGPVQRRAVRCKIEGGRT